MFRLPTKIPANGISDLKLTLKPAKEVVIRVVDGKGSPIAEANVGVIAEFGDAGTARTDKQGTATVFVPLKSEIRQVYAMKAGVGLDYKSYTVPRDRRNDLNYVKPEFPARGVTLTLDGVQPLEVKMLTVDGKPIPKLRAYPWYFQKEGESDHLNLSILTRRPFMVQRTDEKGIVNFPWVPHWQKSRVTIWPNTEEFVGERGMYDPATGNGTLEMRLDRLVPLHGKVVFPDGKPAGGIAIQVNGKGYQIDSFQRFLKTADDGTFEVLAAPNMIYLLVVQDRKWAAEPLTGFAVWPNQPLENMDFKLRPATRIHGRVTLGSERNPVSGSQIIFQQKGADPNTLKGVALPKPEKSNDWPHTIIQDIAMTDADGRYEFFAGPGNFVIMGPNQSKFYKFEIQDEAEKTFDFHMPHPEKGILKGLVVAGDPPRPVVGAQVSGIVRSPRAGDFHAVTNEEGRFKLERDLHLTSLHVQSADGKLGALLEVDADTEEIKIPLQPLATASASLVDGETGKALADREITYGILVYDTEKDEGPFRIAFGGKTTTDAEGRFSIKNLVPGGEYDIDLTVVKGQSWHTIGKVQPKNGEPIDLGKLEYKPRPEYKAPTLGERIARAFATPGTPLERYEAALRDIKLSRQRILLLLADPAGEAAKGFLTLRYEDQEVGRALDEFRLIAVNSASPHETPAKKLAEKFSQNLAGARAKFLLIAVDAEGQPLDSLEAGDLMTAGKMDQKKVMAFLKKHTQKPLDARTLLDETLAQAKRENKRVIVQETATWCGPCWLLSRFLDKHRDLWKEDYIWIKMDHRWIGSRKVMQELRQEAKGGIPWWTILDADGKKLATSNQADGTNIGFPSGSKGIEHFRAMFTQSAQRMTTKQLNALVEDLQAKK